MIGLMIFAAAFVATPDALPAPPPPLPLASEARTVIARQLASPPRSGPAAGLSAEEADVVMEHYLASIGTRLERTDRGSEKQGGSGDHP